MRDDEVVIAAAALYHGLIRLRRVLGGDAVSGDLYSRALRLLLHLPPDDGPASGCSPGGYRPIMTASRSRDLTWIPRLLGVATAGYSVAIIARPELFTKPTALQADGAPLPTATAIGVRALGGRDLASGLAMALAPSGKALRTAIAVRVGADLVDLVVLGTSLPDATARTKAAGVAAAWGTLCGLSYLAAGD